MPRTLSRALIGAGGLALAVAGCGGGEQRTSPAPPATMNLTSSAFEPEADLPREHTCDGEGFPPPLRWSAAPAGTRELALVMHDPDAREGDFVHWVVLALPARARGLPAGTKPATLRLGRASSGRVGYEPPCPTGGDPPHRYVFTVYALRAAAGLTQGAPASAARAKVAQLALARGTLTGRFAR